MIDDMTRVSTT